MLLTSYPFDPATGELLPVYRDAYLRGDLTRQNAALVDAYLKNNAALGGQTWERFHAMQQTGEQVQAVGWMGRQLDALRTSPQRVRRQAASLIVMAALVGGAVFAGSGRVAPTLPTAPGLDETTEALRLTTVHGRILDENGRPLVGATVLEKGTRRAVSTDANGTYELQVSAGRAAVLSYGYAGYSDSEIRVDQADAANMVLLPRAGAKIKSARKAHWWNPFK